jgi:D-sedoheptulose 7-phosphate isomerase
MDTNAVTVVAERLARIAGAGGLLLIAGNGGSAATASHMALDLSKGRPPGQQSLRVRTVSLPDTSPMLTAWANDEGYDRVFAEQIRTLARPGDAVVLLSVSGTSPNIVAAARAARAAGAIVVALTGARGRGMRRLANLAITVPSDDYRVVEDVHLAISHMITAYLSDALTRAKTAATTRSRRVR